MRRIQVGDYMVRSPFIISPDQSVEYAAEYMQECGIRHLPVMSDDELVGIISDRDLKAVRHMAQSSLLRIDDVMKRDVYVVSLNASMNFVCKEMAVNKLGCVVVVDNDEKIAGIFTTIDALHLLSEIVEEGTIEDYLEIEDDLSDFESLESFEKL